MRGRKKLLGNIESAFVACGIGDGATLSFHHHLRNGDQVLNLVLAVAAHRGVKDLTVAASSIFPVHAPLVGHLRSGVVARLTTAYMSGPVAEAVSRGVLRAPVVMTTHGGRARAIESGDLRIDVAFIAAPAADRHGNLGGAEGPAACGPLGYAMVDARHADRVVAITDYLCGQPPCPLDIAQDQVDFVVVVESIGDPRGILSGTTKPTTDPLGLRIASMAADVIDASGLPVEGFSLQTGAGGISFATSMFVRDLMKRRVVVGSFGAGGVTGSLVGMLEAGLFRNIFDEATQTWQVVVERNGKELTLRPKELVFALGVSGLPNVPKFPGADSFQGEQQHSSRHSGPEAYKGKKCVVIGSNRPLKNQ